VQHFDCWYQAASNTELLLGKWMLVTDTSWAESHPVRRALAGPYQAWRCVGWTDEALNFMIVASENMRDRNQLPDGWLVGGPEALLEAASQLEQGAFAVYALDRAVDAAKVDLCQVTGIWRERHGVVPTYWYGTNGGELRPCSGARRYPKAPPELDSELIVGEGAVSVSTDQ
jgi:hypothetical protein